MCKHTYKFWSLYKRTYEFWSTYERTYEFGSTYKRTYEFGSTYERTYERLYVRFFAPGAYLPMAPWPYGSVALRLCVTKASPMPDLPVSGWGELRV